MIRLSSEGLVVLLAAAGGEDLTVIPGNGYLLYWGDLLTAEGWIVNGQMLMAPDGTIEYVGKSASGLAHATGATQILALGAIAGPGLIDAARHTGYWNAPVTVATASRYDQRHDWRLGNRGHAQITVASAGGPQGDELQAIIDGVTSIVETSAGPAGLVRDLARVDATLANTALSYETFPLGDSAGLQTTTIKGYSPSLTSSSLRALDKVKILETGMGIDAEARNEFVSMEPGNYDFLVPGVLLAGATALKAPDFSSIVQKDIGVVWFPRSDLNLYGDTLRVTTARRLGVKVALGSYWSQTGSGSVFRELRLAAEYNQTYLGGALGTRELYDMATANAADLIGVGDRLGRLKAGYRADFIVYRKGGQSG